MDSAIIKKLFQNTMLTMVVAELSGAVTAIIDGVITGRFLGGTGLAACGIGAPYYSIASIISGILMVGATALCTRAVGKGDAEEATRVFSLTILLAVILSVLLAVIGVVFAGGFATLFGARGSSASLHEATSDYLRGVFLGAPGFITYVVLTPLLQLDGDATRPKVASAVSAAVDVAGDLLNVLVFHGGMFGMALASSIGHYTALFIVLTHFFRRSSLFSFSLRDIHFGMTPALMKDGLPRAVCMFCRGLLPIILNTLVLTLAGAAGVTALSAQNSSSFVVGALGWGIGGAVLIMGSMTVGEQDVPGLRTVVKTALKDILIGVTILAVVVFLGAPWIAGLFIPEQGEALSMAVTAIRCYAVTLPFLAFNVSTANYFQAIERRIGAYLVNIFIEVGATAAMALFLSSFLGVFGVWIAFPIGQVLLSLTIFLRAVIGRDKNRKGLVSFMMLRKSFGVPEEDVLESSPQTMEEIVAFSQEADEFCIRHGIEQKRANRLALCIEEMAGNTIEHGFSDGKQHHLDVRVIVKDHQTILRLRDDCVRFDLKEKSSGWAFDPAHPEKNIGIRMVMHAATDIAYTNTMKTNNLIVVV